MVISNRSNRVLLFMKAFACCALANFRRKLFLPVTVKSVKGILSFLSLLQSCIRPMPVMLFFFATGNNDTVSSIVLREGS